MSATLLQRGEDSELLPAVVPHQELAEFVDAQVAVEVLGLKQMEVEGAADEQVIELRRVLAVVEAQVADYG